jgi:hypothetical protein
MISTGGSSLSAVKALRDAGCDVLGMAAIFTTDLKKAAAGFKEEKCELHTLCDYTTLISAALGSGYIGESVVDTLKKWRTDPANGARQMKIVKNRRTEAVVVRKRFFRVNLRYAEIRPHASADMRDNIQVG